MNDAQVRLIAETEYRFYTLQVGEAAVKSYLLRKNIPFPDLGVISLFNLQKLNLVLREALRLNKL